MNRSLLWSLGVHPSWVSCCWHKDITTGRPSCQEAQLTGLEWHTAQPTEAAPWGRTACRGVCSVFLHHRGMHKAFPTNLMYLPSAFWSKVFAHLVCPAAGISCSTQMFNPVCLWLTCLSEWVLYWITSSVVFLSTTPKVVSYWGLSASASPSRATLLWHWTCRVAWRSAWCWRRRSLPRTASSAICLKNCLQFLLDKNPFDWWNDYW